MEKEQIELDQTDFRLLAELAADGRMSDVALGDKVFLSSTAAARRRKILEERGLIMGYTADLDLDRIGYGIMVLVSIELRSQVEQALIEFEEAVMLCPSMSFCSFVSGDTDFVMMLHVKSFNDYNRVYRSELSRLPHVAKIRSSFIMRQVLRRSVPPVVFDTA